MKKKFFLRIAAAAACILAFFANVSINGNNTSENTGLLTFGKSVKAECNEGSVLNGVCNITGTRCVFDAPDDPDDYNCDPNS